jgi:amino acid adenylation domain-containing protein
MSPDHADTTDATEPADLVPSRSRPYTGWNGTVRDYPRDSCVHQLLARHAAAHPGRVAVVDGNRTLTYGELDARANRLARHLIHLGVGRGDSVGVFLSRSLEFVVTALAIVKAGGNYVPLDPEYPEARLASMIESTGVTVVVTVGGGGRFPAFEATWLCLDEMGRRLSTGPSDDPDVRVHPDELVYTMFTSGSTGEPKGVTVTHRGVTRLVQNPDYVDLDHTQVVLHVSSVAFDAATFDIWGALTNGARLVIASPRTSVVELGRLLRRHNVTTVLFPTGLFHVVVGECLGDLAGVRQILVGGDVLSPALANRLLRAFPDCRLINGYGPTEVTTFTTCHQVSAGHGTASPIPIGRPIGNTWVRILDADLEPVPVGGTGQLFAGGDGLARGYLNDPVRTAERFVPDPWAQGQRLYATGDLARYTADGLIEFLGRVDRQIKRRGFRVEPGEIEENLREDPALRDAIVVPDGNSAEERRLIAYLLPELAASGLRATEAPDPVPAVRARLRERLPDYLIPDMWVVLDALPLTSNGKLDRHALPAPAADAVLPRAEPEPAPADSLEATITDIWCEVLELDGVRRHDDFFELGGHSLLANRMVSRLRTALGVEVPLVTIFDHPTIAELTDLVAAAL